MKCRMVRGVRMLTARKIMIRNRRAEIEYSFTAPGQYGARHQQMKAALAGAKFSRMAIKDCKVSGRHLKSNLPAGLNSCSVLRKCLIAQNNAGAFAHKKRGDAA